MPQLIPMMPIFKALLTMDQSASEGEQGPAARANRAKEHVVERLNDVLVPLVFYNDREWFERDDSWVAECLDEWVDPEAEGLFNSSLREDAGQNDLEMFIAAFEHVVERWQAESERAKPVKNPDFDEDEPIEGTQYYKYAKRRGTQDFEWLYASAEDSVDWQPMQVRYDQYEAKIEAQQREVVPYEDYFMKPVDGGWRYGASPDAVLWYGTYEELLDAQVQPYGEYFMRPVRGKWRFGATRDAEDWYGTYEELLDAQVQPYGEYFTRLVSGKWRYGATRDAEVWFLDYEELLADVEKSKAPKPEPEPEKPAAEASADGLDPRVLQPDSKLTEDEAHEILATPKGKQFAEDLEQKVFEQHRAQLEQLLAGTEDLSEADLTKLLELAQKKSV